MLYFLFQSIGINFKGSTLSHKKITWNPNLQHQWMWPCLKTGLLQTTSEDDIILQLGRILPNSIWLMSFLLFVCSLVGWMVWAELELPMYWPSFLCLRIARPGLCTDCNRTQNFVQVLYWPSHSLSSWLASFSIKNTFCSVYLKFGDMIWGSTQKQQNGKVSSHIIESSVFRSTEGSGETATQGRTSWFEQGKE